MDKKRDDTTTSRVKAAVRNGSMASAYYRFLTRHLLGRVEKAGLTPNQISLIGVLCAAAVPPGFAVHPLVGLLFLTGSAVADSLDGLLARKRNQATVFGGFLDDSLGHIAEFLYLVGFWVLFWGDRGWLAATLITMLAIGLTQVSVYMGVRSTLGGIRCPAAILDRTTRIFYLIGWAGMIVLIPGARPAIQWGGLVLYTTLTLATVIHRMWTIYRSTRAMDKRNI